MKKAIAIILMISLIVTASGCGADEPGAMRRRLGRPWHHHESDEAEEDETDEYEGMHIKLSVTDEGYDVFTPGKDINFDYRYGPSILLEDDGGIDAWFSSPADGGELDWITYRHSDDNGKTWSNEKVVLSPDPGSRDALSVCDPDVFYHGGYYYMGYTSTIDDTKQGLANSVFLARSSRPDGPYEKWDGEGWGGDPEPMIYYDGVWSGWGRGEPSFVVVEDTVYVYSTMDSYSNDDERIKSTEVRTADINEEDWPANLEFAGYALIRTDGPDDEGYEYDDCDSLDVAYLEESGRFLAVCTNRRLSDESCILYFESDDGRYFERVAELNDNICCGCHNAGIMSDGLGHIGEDDPVLIGYAYSGADNDVWGTWATRFAPVSVEYTEELDRSEDGKENLTLAFEYRGRMEDPEPIFITADGVSGYARSGGGKFSIDYRWVDSDKNSHRIDASELTFNKYDGNIISIRNGVITAKNAGQTAVSVSYAGLTRKLRLYSLSEGVSSNNVSSGAAEAVVSPVPVYMVSMSRLFGVCIRPIIRYSNHKIRELTIEGVLEHDVNFMTENGAICEVRADGLLLPMSPGDTKIDVTCGGIRCRVDVHVTE